MLKMAGFVRKIRRNYNASFMYFFVFTTQTVQALTARTTEKKINCGESNAI